MELFREWAVVSGKIHEFPNDKARWKTNFRCALNNLQGRFRKIEDNSKSDDPHKVYEIINSESLQMQNSQEDSDPDIYCSPTECFPPGAEINLLNDMKALDISNNMTEPQPFVHNYIIPQASPVLAENYHIVSAPGNNFETPPEQPSYYEPNPVQLNPPQHPSIYDLEISIFYRKKEMLKTVVSSNQVQLHYPLETQDPNSQSICFPSTECLIDCKQIDYTNRILCSIQRGLTLCVQDSGIYACRQDRCHVYASTSDPNVAQPNPQKLRPNVPEQLLSFHTYLQELKSFKENNGRSPQYTINMCFGEKFPDGKALERKLIVVKVVPLICRYFHEQAQMEGASSLNSNISLQLSYNSFMDLINSLDL